MNILTAYIDGIGILGPGIADWPAAQAILTGQAAYQCQATVIPAPMLLPSAERRRCGPIVKLSLAVGQQAAASAELDAGTLPAVFSASGGDGYNCHEICETLATADRLISPTRFHNSVHNAAAGYWSIATGSMSSSSVLCAHDASFAAGLLETMAQVAVDKLTTLLIACDTGYPEPLRQIRDIPYEFGVGLVLSPTHNAQSLAQIKIMFTPSAATELDHPELESIRKAIPAARSLPMLQAIASGKESVVNIDYLDGSRLEVHVSPCSADDSTQDNE